MAGRLEILKGFGKVSQLLMEVFEQITHYSNAIWIMIILIFSRQLIQLDREIQTELDRASNNRHNFGIIYRIDGFFMVVI
jgi:hypothetical protein